MPLPRQPDSTVTNGCGCWRRCAFTLVELLTVIAVLAVLAALILSGINVLRERANEAKCVSNLRQIGVGIRLYSNDNDGKIPTSAAPSSMPGTDSFCEWIALLHNGGYVDTYEIYACPSDAATRTKIVNEENIQVSYGINETLANPNFSTSFKRMQQLTRAPVMPLVADSTVPIITGYTAAFRGRVANANGTGYSPAASVNPALSRHNSGSAVCFVDGHVTLVDQEKAMNGYREDKFNYTTDTWW